MPEETGYKLTRVTCNVTACASHAELKQLMMLHGGRFENYLYRDHVTHIVCNNLPDTKLKQLQHERNPIPVSAGAAYLYTYALFRK